VDTSGVAACHISQSLQLNDPQSATIYEGAASRLAPADRLLRIELHSPAIFHCFIKLISYITTAGASRL